MAFPRIPTILLSTIIITALFAYSCGSSGHVLPQQPPKVMETTDGSSVPLQDQSAGTTSEWVRTTLASMTLEEKAGQLIMARTYGHFISTESDEYERLVRLVKDLKIGGFVVFQGDVYEVAVLLNKLQKFSRLPLLVAGDFERGVAMRIRRATYFPEAMAVGATRNPEYAYRIGKAIAEEARALGIHQNLAPVADVNNNPANPVINTRSFGEDPHLVAAMVASFVRGSNDGGVISTAKHFPGHGDTGIDSHLDLPLLPFDRARLDSVELVSFRSAIQNGVGSIMIAHLEVPAVDPYSGRPATLSQRAVTGVLRWELGFGGLVVTDAMEMQGILKGYSIGESAVLALKAGVDVVLMPADETVAAESIVRAVQSGEVTEARIDSSVVKVLNIKHQLGLDQERFVDVDRIGDHVATDAHQQLAKEVARRAITVLRNDGGVVPLRPSGKQKIALLVIGDSEESRTDVNRPESQLTNEPFGAYFLQQFRRRAGYVESFRVSPVNNGKFLDSILVSTGRYDLLVVALYAKIRSSSGKAELPERVAGFVQKLSQMPTPTVVISFGNPYLIRSFPDACASLCAYSDAEVMVDAAVEAIFGEITCEGRLPVSIPGFAAFGDGLDLRQSTLRRDSPAVAGFDPGKLLLVDSIVTAAIKDSAFPGAQLAIAKDDVLLYNKSFGTLSYDRQSRQVTQSTMYDLASLTKVVATTSAIMRLYEEGEVSLDDFLSKFFPEISPGLKRSITIRHLLSHTSGLPAFIRLYETCSSAEGALDSVYAAALEADPGDTTIYSDLGMILLGKIVERVSGLSLDAYVAKEFFEPLRMNNTMFRPPSFSIPRIAPTEIDTHWRKKLVHGTVHDENAALLGGVSGHAGLFSTASDLVVFMQMMINGGSYGGKEFFQQGTVAEFTRWQSGEGSRALGWDCKSASGSSAGDLFSTKSFGHTGFTGTSLWADPDRDLVVVFLTNRIHPSRERNAIHRIRPLLHNAIIGALRDTVENPKKKNITVEDAEKH